MDSSTIYFDKLKNIYLEEKTFEGFEMSEDSWVPSELKKAIDNFQVNILASAPAEKSVSNILYNSNKKHRGSYNKTNRRKMKQSYQRADVNPLCLFCHRPDYNEIELGKFYSFNNVTVHYYCLLFSSALEQKGEDDEGIEGFLIKDIMVELKRGKKLKCRYCSKNGATIGCNNTKCRKTYHYPCGLNKYAQFDFTDTFGSMCKDHRKFQSGKNIGLEVECPICFEKMNADPKIAIWPPCCQRMWFHKSCIQKVGLATGLYHFKCPLCNCKDESFQIEMQKNGVYLPDRDASWELEPNAFEELTERPDRCSALKCKCPSGREVDIENTRWDLVICNLCGSQCVHRHCVSLPLKCCCADSPACREFECSICLEMLKESSQRIKELSREHRLIRRSKINECNETSTVSIAGSRNSLSNSSLAKRSSSSACHRPSSELEKYINPIADNELNIEDEKLDKLVIRDLERNRKELPSLLQEMKDFAEYLPLRLIGMKMDEKDLLEYINKHDNDDVTEITIEHIKRFIRCSFNFNQMRVMRKILEFSFVLIQCQRNLQSLEIEESPDHKYNRATLENFYKVYQISLVDILKRCKVTNALFSCNTVPKAKTFLQSPGLRKGISVLKSLKEPLTNAENIFASPNSSKRLNKNCSQCQVLLIPRANKTTVILSTGQLQIICSSCHTCNVIDNFFLKFICSETKTTETRDNRLNANIIKDDNDVENSINASSDHHFDNASIKKPTIKQKLIDDYFKKPNQEKIQFPIIEQKPETKRKFIYDYFRKSEQTLSTEVNENSPPCDSKFFNAEKQNSTDSMQEIDCLPKNSNVIQESSGIAKSGKVMKRNLAAKKKGMAKEVITQNCKNKKIRLN